MFVDGHQRDVFVVYDVLRMLEPVVSIQEVLDCYRVQGTELVEQNDVEDLSGSFIVARQASFTQLSCCAVELPVDTLYCDEHQPQQLVQNRRH